MFSTFQSRLCDGKMLLPVSRDTDDVDGRIVKHLPEVGVRLINTEFGSHFGEALWVMIAERC